MTSTPSLSVVATRAVIDPLRDNARQLAAFYRSQSRTTGISEANRAHYLQLAAEQDRILVETVTALAESAA